MDHTYEDFSIIKEKRKQDEEFLSKIQVRNEKEAKLIIAKYDLKNSCLNITTKYYDNYDKIIEESKKYLEERKKFLNLFSEYL
jgi:hypothetical protein